ncbi:MAG: hypothetical protein R6U37_09280 [Dehalococcoidia bacterium]
MSDDFMKSALERAMERADRIEVPEEKLREMEYRAEAERLAAEFLKGPEYDLGAALERVDSRTRPQIATALESVLLQNLVLPKREPDMAGNAKIFEGLASLKKDKDAVRQAKEQLENLAGYYSQARKQHYEQLRAQVEQALALQIRQQTGSAPSGSLNVEQRPEFQENWRRVSAQLDGEYEGALAQLKERITSAG